MDNDSAKKRLLFLDYSNFENISFINNGYYASVKRAYYKGEKFAIKQPIFEDEIEISKDNVYKGFETRIKLLELKHINIIQIKFITKIDDIKCIVFEYADFSLYELLHKSNYTKLHYSPELALLWLLQLARALNFLHSRNPIIIHRDVKSPNVLLFGDCRLLKLADFGHATEKHNAMTKNVGSLKWMAPENMLIKDYTEKSDIYSFAIVMWEILSRTEPYTDDYYSTMNQIQFVFQMMQNNFRPPFIQNTPTVLINILEICWHKEYALRLPANKLATIFDKLLKTCPSVKPVETAKGSEYFEETNLPDSLLEYTYEKLSSRAENTTAFPGFESLEELQPVKCISNNEKSIGMYENHLNACKLYLQHESKNKELINIELNLNNEIMVEQETLIRDYWSAYKNTIEQQIRDKIEDKRNLITDISQI